jgi:hypothetical protein
VVLRDQKNRRTTKVRPHSSFRSLGSTYNRGKFGDWSQLHNV